MRAAAALAICSAVARASAGGSLTRYVNPLIGTAPANDATSGINSASGDVFPGAVFPRGMLQWSPDTPTHLPGGYDYPDKEIKGFSLRHFSGRGCVAWQDFAFMPVVGDIKQPPSKDNDYLGCSYSHANESASPGYYRVRLDNGVQVELAATPRTGIARFTFPDAPSASVLINAASSITGATPDTSISVLGDDRVQGKATARVGCGKELYTIYFAAQFNRPFRAFGCWRGDRIEDGSRAATGAGSGAILSFDASADPIVLAKVGISFVSVENAVQNLDAEDSGWSFDAVKAAADAAWDKTLARITLTGGSDDEWTVFYTALYHCFLHPNVFSDVNGQYLGMDGAVHNVEPGRAQYENVTSWDGYRSTSPLIALLDPKTTGDIMQSLVNDAAQGGGGLPRWEQANRNSAGMVGDGQAIMLADARAYGAGNFDAKAALAAMVLDAGSAGAKSDGHVVRSGLAQYIDLGYIPGLASVNLEYASADFALSQFAAALGDREEAALFLRRSGNWRKLYNPATGLIQAKESDGSWVSDVVATTRKGYTEGSAAEYTWMVPFDLRGLFDRMGGNARVVARLDDYFTKLNEGPRGEGQYAWMGNEPSEGDPWEYDYAGAPARTQDVNRRIETQLFSTGPDGLPGNDDGGALSSWYVFAALGLYPNVPGVGGYVLGSPLFPVAVVHLENGASIEIDGAGASPANRYVQSMTLDGEPSSQLWIPFERLGHGAKLAFALGDRPSEWGTRASDAPPSFGPDETP